MAFDRSNLWSHFLWARRPLSQNFDLENEMNFFWKKSKFWLYSKSLSSSRSGRSPLFLCLLLVPGTTLSYSECSVVVGWWILYEKVSGSNLKTVPSFALFYLHRKTTAKESKLWLKSKDFSFRWSSQRRDSKTKRGGDDRSYSLRPQKFCFSNSNTQSQHFSEVWPMR